MKIEKATNLERENNIIRISLIQSLFVLLRTHG